MPKQMMNPKLLATLRVQWLNHRIRGEEELPLLGRHQKEAEREVYE